MYFSFFPSVNSYPITITSGDNTNQYSGMVSFGDIFRNISVVDIKKKHSFYYQTERIMNGERPDQLSQRLYGTPNYFWTFFIINDHLRLGENLQWPLDENHLRRKLANDYCGKSLISYKSRYILGFKPQVAFLKDNTNVLKRFEIGETIQGQQSGARGMLRLRNSNLGQLVVVPETTQVQFKKGELILGLTSGCSLFIHDTIEYQDAPMFYIDEDERECSHPNFIRMGDGANETQFTSVSAKEHWFRVNDELSSINVLQRSSLVKFDDAFRTLISSRQVTTK